MADQQHEDQSPSGGQPTRSGTVGTARWILTGVIVIVLLVLAVILGVAEDRQKSSSSSSPEPKSESKPTASSKQNSVSLSGYGNRSQQIELKQGAATFTYSYHNTERQGGNFIVALLDEQGKQLGRRVVNEIGDTEGSTTTHIPRDGTYTINVQATTGQWTLEIE